MDKSTLIINEIREKLIGHWLYNFKQKKINNEILLVDFKYSHLFQTLKKNILKLDEDCTVVENGKLINKDSFKNYLFDSYTSKQRDKLQIEDKNIVAVSSFGLYFKHFRDILKPVLILGTNSTQSDVEIESMFDNIEKNIDTYKEAPAVSKEMRYLFYIEPINPVELIKSENTKALREFLIFKLFDYELIIDNIKHPVEAIITKTNFEGYYHLDSDLLRELIGRDLILFENKKIFTSRLAVVLYRVATLNVNANITAIGRYYSDALSVSSKNFYSVYQGFSDDFNQSKGIFKNFKKKSFKGYELGKAAMTEYDTRIEIAKNLIKNTTLDTNTIAQITQLAKEVIRNL